MEIKLAKNDFLNLLKWSLGIVEKRGTMPILTNVLIETKPGELIISATDLELSLVASCKTDVKVAEKFVLNAKQLYEIIKESRQGDIVLRKTPGHVIEISSGKSLFKMVGMNPDEFPALPQVTAGSTLRVASQEIEDMIQKTFYAASTDESRFTLNGLYLCKIAKGDKNYLRMVASDGHRLSYDEREVQSGLDLEKGLIIPRKGISEVKSLLSGYEGEVNLSVGDNAISFERDQIRLTIRLIEGDFPAYEQVIPKKLDRIAVVDRAEMMGALRRVSIMTSEQARGIKFQLSPDMLTVSSSHPNMGEAKEEIPIQLNGQGFQVGFNPKYFLDILNILDDEKIVMEMKDEVSPCVIRSEFDRGFLAMVMPMRI